MAFNKTEKTDSPMKRRGGIRRRKKVCVFCGKDNVIDYKVLSYSNLILIFYINILNKHGSKWNSQSVHIRQTVYCDDNLFHWEPFAEMHHHGRVE